MLLNLFDMFKDDNVSGRLCIKFVRLLFCLYWMLLWLWMWWVV